MTFSDRSSPGLAKSALIGGLGGAIAFQLGPGVESLLHPPASATAPVGDTAMALSGAYAFIADTWRLPLFDFEGLSEIHETNAVFTDSMPLYALLWKLAARVITIDFALYLPIWVLLLFLWQGAAGAMALRLLGVREALLLGASALLLALWPAFLFRIPLHAALSAHGFVVIAAAMMLARPEPNARLGRRVAGWGVLLAAAALVHGYLAAMVLVAYALQGLALLVDPPARTSRLHLLGLGFLPLAGLIAVMAVAGYFGGAPGEAGGFGHFHLNLAAPLMHGGDSLLPEFLEIPDGQKSGFAYVPVGGWVLLALALALTLTGSRHQSKSCTAGNFSGALVLLAGCLGVLLFATAGRLAWAQAELLVVPFPKLVEDVGDVLRGSGRFVWLPLYALLLLASARISLVLSPMRAGGVIAMAAVLIAIEMSPLRNRVYPEPGLISGDPVIAAQVRAAKRVAVFPAWGCDTIALHQPGVDKEIQYHTALGQGHMVNSFAAARIERVCDKVPPPEFVAEPGALLVIKRGAAGLGPLDRVDVDPRTCFGRQDLALCGSSFNVSAALEPVPSSPLTLPANLAFVDIFTADAHLGRGFAQPEPWGVWTVADRAVIPLAFGAPVTAVVLRMRGFVPDERPDTGATITLETYQGTWRQLGAARLTFARGEGPQEATFELREGEAEERIRIIIEPDQPISPQELGRGKDRRRLGVGLIRLTAR
ncbi:MAG: hypothetical protein AAF183_02615 [Pseudomonadota bacterium]